MPEQILGLPGGMAVRRLGFDPIDWATRMALRAQVVRAMDEATDEAKVPRVWVGQRTVDVRKDVR